MYIQPVSSYWKHFLQPVVGTKALLFVRGDKYPAHGLLSDSYSTLLLRGCSSRCCAR